MNQVVPRNTVEYIIECRDKALELYELAFGKIAEADAAIKQAADMWWRASPNMSGYYVGESEEIKSFHSAVTLPDRELYMRTARKLIDCTVWDHIVTLSGLESLMDKQSKDELRAQMKYVPERPRRNGEVIDEEEAGRALPPVTVGNVVATLERFMGDSEMIFRRGLANAFSKLDRRFRSHNGFRIGDRIVLSYAFDEYGSWCYSRSHRDTIADIERAFRVIDGQDPTHNSMGIVWVVDKERRTKMERRQSEHEGEFFRIRIFKNGNAHLWFTRKDLLEKVNRILAEWYGEVVGDANTTDDDPLAQVKTAPAKYYGFYPTPSEAAERLVNGDTRYNRGVSWMQETGKPPLRVLEPSAGTGNLARLCAAKDTPEPSDYMKRGNYQQRVTVDCVEIQPHLAAGLEAQGLYRKVTCADFMALQPDPANLYDVVMMNPPFDRERDIDHVCHALKFLKPGGTLHAIMSAGTEFRSTRKAEAFRALMERLGASWDDLPPNSFSEVGTNVNTLILRVRKPG